MTASIWNDIDSYLVSGLRVELMEGGPYADRYVAQVEAGEAFDPAHAALPFVLVRGVEMVPGDDAAHLHGDVVTLAEIAYPYEVYVAGTGDSYATLYADLKEWARRIREFLRNRPAFGGLQSNDGENIWNVWPGKATIEVQGSIGDGQGSYIGFCKVEFTILTEIV